MSNKIYDVIIVGGGPAGLSAALYSLRFNKTVLVIEKESFGGQMTYSPKIENYPGFPEISGAELADKMSEQILDKGAEVELAEVTEIIPGKIHTVITEYGEFNAKTVIIATGVKHRRLGLENEEAYIGKGIYFCAVCDGKFFENKKIILVGGGNSALQEVIMLSEIASEITVIQNLPTFTGEEALINIVKSKPNIKCEFSTVVNGIISENGIFKGLKVQNTENGNEKEIFASAAFVAIGLVPDNKRFENAVQIESHGYFDIDETCKTKTDGIFVAGDCRSKSVRQILTAESDGATAAIAASTYIDKNS